MSASTSGGSATSDDGSSTADFHVHLPPDLNETDLDQFELLGISDLVVSSPLSSIFFESILSGKKTIIYDPLKQYNDHQVFTKSLPKINAHNHEELIELISMWQAASNEYLNEYLISHFKISLKDLETQKLYYLDFQLLLF